MYREATLQFELNPPFWAAVMDIPLHNSYAILRCKHPNDSAREGLLTNHSVPKLALQAESPVDNVGETVPFVVLV